MRWKQELAKIKQDLKAAGEPDQKAPPPKKVVPKPREAQTIEDEDALFLAAMGGRPKSSTSPSSDPVGLPAAEPEAPRLDPVPEGFEAAMAAMKGLRVVPDAPVVAAAKVSVASSAPLQPVPLEEVEPQAPPPLPVEPALPVPPVEIPPPAPAASHPAQIQLAAGMAIEVDACLDLKGHSAGDALERLRERVQDGAVLGWRTFHVILGPSSELREVFFRFLQGPESRAVARFAQAPIPMGGGQAWILYFGPQGLKELA